MMKQLFGWLLLAGLLHSHTLTSQNSKIYTIQIGTFLNAKSSDFESIRPLGMIYAQRLDNNLYRVFLGGYESQESAQKMVSVLQQRGYTNAAWVEIPIDENRTVTVIQIEMLNAKKPISWNKYTGFENLYAIILGDHVKLVIGPYPDVAAARPDLEKAKSAGFSDAFVKSVSTAYLQKISSFETGVKQPLIPLNLQAGAEPAGNPVPAAAKSFTDQPAPKQAAAVPAAETTTARGVPDPDNTARPDIRSNVKRRSVIDLQTALRAENAYTGSLDGLYGNGTRGAYEQALRSNRDLQKYQLLTRSVPKPSPAGADPFLAWDEIRLSLAIGYDLDGAAKLNGEPLRRAAAERTRLAATTQPLTAPEAEKVEEWNDAAWQGLNRWAASDPLHERLVDAFKVAYFQSQVILEDYFMNRGFTPEEARGLALASLMTLVGPHLERFI